MTTKYLLITYMDLCYNYRLNDLCYHTREGVQGMYRQGDVLIKPIKSIPNESLLKKVDKDDGRVILAYGEVTGHCHAFERTDKVALFMEQVDAVLGGGGAIANASRFPGRQSAPVALQEREPERMPNVRRFLRVEASSSLMHDEHGKIDVPPGDYEIIIQREYSPDAVRQVAD